MAKTDFLTLLDHGRDDLDRILQSAKEMKRAQRAGEGPQPLKGRVLGVIFHKPSLRTRISFEVGMAQLGGTSLYITDQEIGFGKREAIKDIGQVLSRFLDGIMIRTFAHDDVEKLAAASTVPVVNGLTDWTHPCQIMADMLTIQEKGLDLDALTLTYIGDGNNVTNSWIHATKSFGIDLRVACPEGYEPSEKSMALAAGGARGTVRIIRDPREALSGAQVVYADTWTSMGQEAEAAKRREDFAQYQLNHELLGCAADGALVMHCLPAHRGEEITDEVIDGPQSVVYDQAENRLHAQKGILVFCMGTAR